MSPFGNGGAHPPLLLVLDIKIDVAGHLILGHLIVDTWSLDTGYLGTWVLGPRYLDISPENMGAILDI